MRINHLAVYTQDIERLRLFYELYFHAHTGEPYHNPLTGLKTYFLTFDDGDVRLELMTGPELNTNMPEEAHTGYAHLAFSVGSREAVNLLTARIQSDHYQVLSAPRTTGD